MNIDERRDIVERLIADTVEDTDGIPGLVVGEFVIIAATNGWNAEGESVSQVVIIPDGGGESRILGLIEHARISLHADVLAVE